MHEMQLTIDGEWEATAAYCLRELFAELPRELEPKIRVSEAVLIHPMTTAFAKNSLPICEFGKMMQAIRCWLEDSDFPALESFCRADRNSRQETDSAVRMSKGGVLKEDLAPPPWYRLYLKTNHWQDLRNRAARYYGGCVLCGSIDQLNVHHRHYHSLGNEDMAHLSVFCKPHHDKITVIHGMSVPKLLPDGVARVFQKEGVNWA